MIVVKVAVVLNFVFVCNPLLCNAMSVSAMSPKKHNKKSEVWKYFINNKFAKSGQCKICFAEIKTSGNTTNLSNHLKRKHKNEFYHHLNHDKEDDETESTGTTESIETDTECSSASSSSFSAVPMQTQSSLSTASTSSLSLKSCSFTSDTDSASAVEAHKLQEKHKQPRLGSQPLITKIFSDIKSHSDGGKKSNQITNSVIYMIAKDHLPLNTTEKEGFRFLMHTIAPLYKVPDRKTITTLIDEKYNFLSECVKEKLSHVLNLSITTDVWTETMQTKSFLGLTCHFLLENKLQTLIIGVNELSESHTGDYLGKCLQSIFEEWGIDKSKIVAIVTDNGANMVKAVHDSFGKNKHLPCFAHTLNLVATEVTAEDTCKVVINKVKDIVTYFKHNVWAADQLRACQTTIPLKLIQSVPTRWNSTYYMLERFIKLSKYIAPILLQKPKSPSMLVASEVQVVEEILEMLKPIESVTKEICGEGYLTASKIIPIINCLLKKIQQLTPTTDQAINMQHILFTALKKRFGAVEQVKLLAVSTLLDPRFKKLHFVNIQASQAIHYIEECSKELDTPAEMDTVPELGIVNTEREVEGLWSFHEQLLTKFVSEKQSQSDSRLSADFTSYLNQNPLPLKTDPIHFWDNYKLINANLAMVAKKHMCLVGTSVPCERLFSKAGQIISQSRNRLEGKRLSKLLFLNSLNFVDWKL